MILQVMAGFDIKARAYLLPFYVTHLAVGVRSFAAAVNQVNHQMNLHPEDFALYHLGSFNDETAMFSLLPNPVHLATALQMKDEKNVQSKVA